MTPGFINTHAHLTESPIDKSFVEDRGPRQFYLSGLFEYLPPRDRVMTEQGLPVVSFTGNRKSRSSVITKLLAKRDNLAAQLFDKLRYRTDVPVPVLDPNQVLIRVGAAGGTACDRVARKKKTSPLSRLRRTGGAVCEVARQAGWIGEIRNAQFL